MAPALRLEQRLAVRRGQVLFHPAPDFGAGINAAGGNVPEGNALRGAGVGDHGGKQRVVRAACPPG